MLPIVNCNLYFQNVEKFHCKFADSNPIEFSIKSVGEISGPHNHERGLYFCNTIFLDVVSIPESSV
jgi:hypothetical protein